MKKTATFKKMISMAVSMSVMASMFAGIGANAMTYRTLTYKAGDVDGVVGETEYNFEKIINTTFDTALSNRFSRKGYTIKSWYVPSTGETVGTGVQYVMPDNDITFVANWDPMKYDVSFAGKGGKTADGKTTLTSTAVFGTDFILPENEFTYNNYEFEGWKYGDKIYEAGSSFEVPALISGSKIVFSAVWDTEQTATNPVTTAATTTSTTTTTTTTTKATTAATTTTTTNATTAATTTTTTTTKATTAAATTTTTTKATTAAATTTTTTKATTAATTTTTTTTKAATVATTSTTAAVSGVYTKTFEIDAKLNFTYDDEKTYNALLSDIISVGKVAAIDINVHTAFNPIGEVQMGIGANIDGEWTDFELYGNVDSFYHTVRFADAALANMDGEYLMIGYWYGTATPLYVDSITVTYSELAQTTAPATEAETVTTTTQTEAESDKDTEETTVSFDYNNDGVVDAKDADALKKYVVGVKVEGFVITNETADVNKDGSVNVFDYMALSRIIG